MIHKIQTIKTLLENNNISYWLDCGSLIHLYRDGYLEKDDVDFGVLIEDYNRLIEILNQNKSLFEMIHIRNKEISIRYLGIKFDFLMYEIHEEEIYLYAYKQNPFCGNKWNWEWRAKFPKNVILPIRKKFFNDIEISVPNDIETRIALQYGENWKTPINVPSWTYEMNLAKDEKYVPIAVVMTTFLRDDILKKVLPSYLQYPVKLYLLDQGFKTPEKNKLYDELRKLGHYIEYCEFDIGLSKVRNMLLDEVEEEYVLITEDDIELKTNPYTLFNYFTNNNLGVLGGLLIRQPSNSEQHYEYELEINDKRELIYKKSDKLDIVLNFALAKRKLFDDIRYDNNLLLAEHTDFYLRLKELKKWRVDYCKNFIGNHHADKPKQYRNYRNRGSEYSKLFQKKWNLINIIREEKNILENKINLISDLTVFLIISGEDINYKDTLIALQTQNCSFNLEIIKDYHPMSAAFQEMINRCKTPYYIQCDSDMVLQNDAIYLMYQKIKKSSEKTAMICFKLKDLHLNKNIEGIKIYKYDIFKNYPYENIISCDMNQLEKLSLAGYSIERNALVVGAHSPKWSDTTIFHRYYSFALKHLQKNSENLGQMMQNLFQIFLKEPNKLNWYALLGGLGAILTQEKNFEEKDFTQIPTKEYRLLDKIFATNDILSRDKKIENSFLPLALQISNIPCANRPYNISKLISMYSIKFESRHILCSQYGKTNPEIPYREFPEDLNWRKNPQKCIELLNQAKIIHIHHNISKDMLKYIPKTTPIIWTVSNLSQSLSYNNNDFNKQYNAFIKSMTSIITTTEEPLQKQAFGYLTNISLPLVPPIYTYPIIKDNLIPTVVFAPTNRVNYKINSLVSKGYADVLKIIDDLKKICDFNFILVEGIPYEENLNIKKGADIIIDDMISTTYHNSSIEAVYFNAVPLTNYESLSFPFIKTNLQNLKEVLYELLLDRNKLEKEKEKISKWKNIHCDPLILLKKFELLYEYCLGEDSRNNRSVSNNLSEDLNPLEILFIVDNICNEHQIELILLEQTCKEYIIKHDIISHRLVLSTTNNQLLKELLKQRGFIENNDLLYCGQTSIRLKNNTIPDTKLGCVLHDKQFSVPRPVISYLTSIYGEKWNE